MLLRQILRNKGHEIHTISSSESCDRAVTELVRFNIGSLLVRDVPDGPILGIITERDILRAQASHRAPLEKLLVATVTSTELVTAHPDDHIMVAMRLMTTHRIRHLPVFRGKELCGIVSIGDIVKAHHDELESDNHYMRSYIRGDVAEEATPTAEG